VKNGGVTANAGDYGFEPNGIVHDHTEFPVPSVLYFTNFGPVNFTDENGRTAYILDWREILRLEVESEASVQKAA